MTRRACEARPARERLIYGHTASGPRRIGKTSNFPLQRTGAAKEIGRAHRSTRALEVRGPMQFADDVKAGLGVALEQAREALLAGVRSAR